MHSAAPERNGQDPKTIAAVIDSTRQAPADTTEGSSGCATALTAAASAAASAFRLNDWRSGRMPGFGAPCQQSYDE